MSVLIERKGCATCTWWDGERRILPNGIGVECRGGSQKGICKNSKCNYNGKETLYGYGSCHHYEKWSVLTKLKA